jgi:hypothetical protein
MTRKQNTISSHGKKRGTENDDRADDRADVICKPAINYIIAAAAVVVIAVVVGVVGVVVVADSYFIPFYLLTSNSYLRI